MRRGMYLEDFVSNALTSISRSILVFGCPDSIKMLVILKQDQILFVVSECPDENSLTLSNLDANACMKV